MSDDKIEILRGDASDPYSFSGDGNEDGDVVTQHRFYQWGDDCVIAIGELNHRNQWDDEAFDAKCERLVSALSTPSPDSGERMREALAWYGEQARLAKLIHSEGDAGRHALANDGGKRATAALQESAR
jgi:hypothetical protein